ncbi:MAG TPA: hypothetical protein VGE47_00720 [Burkholderiaceae bacterium]
MVLGIVLIVSGRSAASKSNSVTATDGSVAVGGSNSGNIINTKIAPAAPAQHGSHWLTKVGIVVELAGIGVALFHLWHQAHT